VPARVSTVGEPFYTTAVKNMVGQDAQLIRSDGHEAQSVVRPPMGGIYYRLDTFLSLLLSESVSACALCVSLSQQAWSA
jgi:hypothetical protein